MISDQIIFMDRAKFDLTFGDLTCFLQNKMVRQNKNINVNRIRKIKIYKYFNKSKL